MATFLDTGLLGFFMPLFVFLFIFVVLYALLAKTELLGKNTALNLIAAICVAAVAIFAGNLVQLIGAITPWLVFLIIILAIIFGMYQFFGIKESEVWETIGGQVVIYIIIILIVLMGLATVFQEDVTPGATNDTISAPGEVGGSGKSEIISSLSHPRLLGALFILIVAAFTAKLLIDKDE